MNDPKLNLDALSALLDRCYRYVGSLPQHGSASATPPEHDVDGGHISSDSIPRPKLYKKAVHRPENKNYLAEKVRYESGILLGILDPNKGGVEPIVQIDNLVTASRSALRDFKDTRKNGPTVDKFILQLDKGKATVWNKAAAEVFCKYFRSKEGYESYKTKDVYLAFMAHITQIKRMFARKGRSKTIREKDEDKLARRLARRHTLLTLRISMFYSIYGRHKGPLGELSRFIRHLTPECMSGDETGSDGKYYKTKVEWRSQELNNFLNLLSAWYLKMRYLDYGKYSPGELPRPRYPSDRIDTVFGADAATAQLPVNCLSDIT
ncbi:hypothetical protein LENED_012012 [Lentinula edodes]|uniref:Uncharacterized protein n=1 Tax=Lentinula edodes TaxID=5353 RepID=A0A1Q3ERI6_LENED|nr:hypothetical protein LENED_012012 [Lentinula edodes]